MSIEIPLRRNEEITITTKEPGVTIKCVETNESWMIECSTTHPRIRCLPINFLPLLLLRFPSLLNHLPVGYAYHDKSLITHNRHCLEPLVNMIFAGHRDGKDDGRNQYTNHTRQLVWNNTSYQPVWTIEEIYKKERVPSFIERTWEQMV